MVGGNFKAILTFSSVFEEFSLLLIGALGKHC